MPNFVFKLVAPLAGGQDFYLQSSTGRLLAAGEGATLRFIDDVCTGNNSV